MKVEMITMRSRRLSQLMLMLLLISSIPLFSACTVQKTVEHLQSIDNERQLAEENARLVGQVTQLQQELLEKQTEINQFVLSQEHASREIVHTPAKLRTHNSKAEIVATIAEVRAEIKVVAAKSLTEQQLQVVSEAEQRLALCIVELKSGTLDAASNLVNEAQQFIQPLRDGKPELKIPRRTGADIVFVMPLTMKVIRRCNVRQGPGMKNNVLFVLDRGKTVQALAYVRNWIQIEDDHNKKGWVYYQLLEVVQE